MMKYIEGLRLVLADGSALNTIKTLLGGNGLPIEDVPEKLGGAVPRLCWRRVYRHWRD